jgi:hypothetical protein
MCKGSHENSRFIGLGAAVKRTGMGAARLLRLALIGELSHEVTRDKRVIFPADQIEALCDRGSHAVGA